MHDVLVRVTRVDTWSNSLRYAAQLASLLKASLTALDCGGADRVDNGRVDNGRADPDRVDTMGPAIDGAMDSGGMEGGGVEAGGADGGTSAGNTIDVGWQTADAFESYAASLGVKHSTWVAHDGNAGAALAHMALWHDLLVMSPEAIASPRAEATLAHLVLVVQLPCLLVPDAWTSALRPASIAVAWDGSAAAVRALHVAIPLLERAGRVVLLDGSATRVPGLPSRQPPFDLDGYCQRHDLRVERVPIDRTDGRAGAWSGRSLLEAALAAKPELLVVGAMGRTRMSERLFDSVTQHLVRNCPVPLLLRH